MRFSCRVEVFNRLSATGAQPRMRSTITVGGYGPSNVGGKLWILHQTLQNPSGIRYKVTANVLALFTKFLHEGKVTVRLREPAVDLRIMGDTATLKRFADLLKEFLLGRTPAGCRRMNLTNLETVPKKMERPPVRNLIIRSLVEYRSVKGAYPSSLSSLTVRNVALEAFEPRMFRLEHLTVLDLRCNKIRFVPKSIELLNKLTVLNLSGNELGVSKREEDWDWLRCKSIRKNLSSLDLSSNQISVLPNTLGHLDALNDLNLHDNCLSVLPNNLGFAKKLSFLSLRKNRLTYVPASFLHTMIDTLDLSENDFSANFLGEGCYTPDAPVTLKNLASRVVLRSSRRSEFDESELPRELIRHLESASYCVCKKAMFPSTPTLFARVFACRLASCVTYQSAVVIGYRPCSIKCSVPILG